MFTLQITASSTCQNTLGFSFFGRGGSLLVRIPGLAQNHEATVVDRLNHVPSFLALRNRCRHPAEVTITSIKLGFGSCNSLVGPTLEPTTSLMPSPVPQVVPL